MEVAICQLGHGAAALNRKNCVRIGSWLIIGIGATHLQLRVFESAAGCYAQVIPTSELGQHHWWVLEIKRYKGT